MWNEKRYATLDSRGSARQEEVELSRQHLCRLMGSSKHRRQKMVSVGYVGGLAETPETRRIIATSVGVPAGSMQYVTPCRQGLYCPSRQTLGDDAGRDCIDARSFRANSSASTRVIWLITALLAP